MTVNAFNLQQCWMTFREEGVGDDAAPIAREFK
jgi:hypothetical protein